MFWYSLLAVLGVLFLLSVALPVPRRIWAFVLYSSKYFWLWVADALGLRKLFVSKDKYVKLTRPMLLRMWCEDMGPTFIKFGQIIASSAGMFPDPYVKEFTEEGHTRRSVPLTAETLRAADAAMIVTDHSSLDYGLIRREARSVTDTRNALASRKG